MAEVWIALEKSEDREKELVWGVYSSKDVAVKSVLHVWANRRGFKVEDVDVAKCYHRDAYSLRFRLTRTGDEFPMEYKIQRYDVDEPCLTMKS
jgi:hypothetical protein